MSRPSSKSGFTLLEIMLSITLLALMAVMILQVFSAGSRAVRLGKNQTLLDEAARNLLDVLERDITQALIRTNVPFRVETIESDPFNSLYWVTAGVRRNLQTIPRDFAPMRIQVSKTAEWNQSLVLDRPNWSAGSGASHRSRLSAQSDYYFSPTNTAAADFTGVERGNSMYTTTRTYTDALDAFSTQYAMLTTFRIIVNGEPAWDGNAGAAGTPDPDNMPAFADLRIGLTPSTIVRRARRLAEAGQTETGRDLIIQNEQLYTRRVFMPNTGTTGLDFQ